MTDPVELHLEHLMRDRYSPATITARRRLLASMPDPLSIDRETMEAWWTSRQTTSRGEPRAAASLSGEQSHLRAFYRWALRQGLIEHNPTDWLGGVRQTSTMANPVREGDLARAMREAPREMRRMLALGSMAGLRSAEIARVRWADIDRDAGVLWVRQGKGGKDRSVPLSGGLLYVVASTDTMRRGAEACGRIG